MHCEPTVEVRKKKYEGPAKRSFNPLSGKRTQVSALSGVQNGAPSQSQTEELTP